MICNTRGHSVSCKMQRKSCKSHGFFSHGDIQCGKKSHRIFCMQELARSHHLIFIRCTLNYVWFSGDPTDTPYPPLPFKHYKGFSSSAICPSRVRNGVHFYHSMRVLFSWAQLGPEHEITIWAGKDPAGSDDRCDRRRLRRACVFAPSRQGLAH